MMVRKPNIRVWNDGIGIFDMVYRLQIPNYVIRSISWCETTPKALIKLNAYAGIRRQKGVFIIKDENNKKSRSIHYIDRIKMPCIKIETTKEPIFINYNSEEDTKDLFSLMQKELRFIDASKLETFKSSGITTRTAMAIAIYFAALLLPTLFIFKL